MKNDGRKYVSSSERAMNAVFIIIIVAILALGVYAAGTKLYNIHSDSSATEQTEDDSPSTVQEQADELGLSVDEFKAEYGLADDVTGETDLNNVYGTMTVENYAKLMGEDAETFLEESHLTGIVDATTTMDEAQEAYMLLPITAIYSEEELADAKSTYGISDDEVTDATTVTDFNNLINEKYNEMMLAQEAAEAEEDATSDTEADVVTDTADTTEESAADTDAAQE